MKTILTLKDIGEFILAKFWFSRKEYAQQWFPPLFGYDFKYADSLMHTHLGGK